MQLTILPVHAAGASSSVQSSGTGVFPNKSLEIPEAHPNLRQKTQTPLQVAAWEGALRSNPDTEFADLHSGGDPMGLPHRLQLQITHLVTSTQ